MASRANKPRKQPRAAAAAGGDPEEELDDLFDEMEVTEQKERVASKARANSPARPRLDSAVRGDAGDAGALEAQLPRAAAAMEAPVQANDAARIVRLERRIEEMMALIRNRAPASGRAPSALDDEVEVLDSDDAPAAADWRHMDPKRLQRMNFAPLFSVSEANLLLSDLRAPTETSHLAHEMRVLASMYVFLQEGDLKAANELLCRRLIGLMAVRSGEMDIKLTGPLTRTHLKRPGISLPPGVASLIYREVEASEKIAPNRGKPSTRGRGNQRQESKDKDKAKSPAGPK